MTAQAFDGTKVTAPTCTGAAPIVNPASASSAIGWVQDSPPRVMKRTVKVFVWPLSTARGSVAHQSAVGTSRPSDAAQPQLVAVNGQRAGAAVLDLHLDDRLDQVRARPFRLDSFAAPLPDDGDLNAVFGQRAAVLDRGLQRARRSEATGRNGERRDETTNE